MNELPPNFKKWFRAAVGVSFEGAKQRGAWDLELIEDAFKAGQAYARAAIEAHEARKVPDGWQLVPKELLLRAQDSLGSFISDQGWGASDMDTFDEVSSLLASSPPAPQAEPCLHPCGNIKCAVACKNHEQACVMKPEPERINYLVVHEFAQFHRLDYNKTAAMVRKALMAHTHPTPVREPLHDDIQSVLFEVEQAIENGCCPWQIEAAFEAYEAARRLQEPAHGITKDTQ